MSRSAKAAICGPYELVAQEPDSLFELADGSVELLAERSYLVRLGRDASPGALRGALRVPEGGSEGMLRFGDFVGVSRLGGRRLEVRSNRIDAGAVDRMLDEVSERLASLPFGSAAPTEAAYERVNDVGPDALYHAFAVLRDAMRGLGRDDLRAALSRVLARPHESLRLAEPRLDPVGVARRFDGQALEAILSEPELLSPVAEGSPLAVHPLARALGGTMPEFVRSRPTLQSTDSVENRFVVGALTSMIDLLQRFERLVRSEDRVSAAVNATEARELADSLRRYRRHRVLEAVPPMRLVPLHSTVLRARPGYRDVLRVYLDLLGRTRRAESHATQALLEVRDAAVVYEYWTFFRVVAALSALLGEPEELSRFAVDTYATRVPYRYSVGWDEVTVAYNETFSAVGGSGEWPGSTSYSLSLRPDITVRIAGGGLHLLDAKLKVDFAGAAAGAPAADGARPDTFKREDLHKMHAYRDALGADSVWVLYPGMLRQPIAFPAPQPTGAGAAQPVRGVGAVALRPDAGHDGGLAELLERMLSSG